MPRRRAQPMKSVRLEIAEDLYQMIRASAAGLSLTAFALDAMLTGPLPVALAPASSRPRKSLFLELTPAQLAKIDQRAKRVPLSRSDFARACLYRAALSRQSASQRA